MNFSQNLEEGQLREYALKTPPEILPSKSIYFILVYYVGDLCIRIPGSPGYRKSILEDIHPRDDTLS